jgi:hypothetical protein
VGELVDENTGSWNISIVHEIFQANEVEIICNLPLSWHRQGDQLIWRGTSTGIFTVRSTYHMEMKRKMANRGEGSQRVDNLIWKSL